MTERAWPTTADFVEGIALAEPGRLAIVDDGHPVSYAMLHTAVLAAAARLHARGVRAGQRVAIGGRGFSAQLALLFASEWLGAATASFGTPDDPDASALCAKVDWVAAPEPVAGVDPARFVQVDAALFAPVEAVPAIERVAGIEGDAQRVVRTSGSLGPAKFMLLSRSAQEYWIRHGGHIAGYTRDTRLWCAGPLVMNAAYTRLAACLRLGACVLQGAHASLPDAAVTHLWGLPGHVERVLEALPAGWRSPRPIAVGTGGGTLGPTTRRRLEAVFGGPVTNRYGGNEAYMVCDDVDAGGTGWLSPGVDLRIVDDDGRDVAPGVVGRLVVRGPAMAQGYLDLPDATAAAFRDGWFHMGDVGRLVGPRRLQLLGRHDDLLDVAGLKLPSSRFEEALRAALPLRECAVVAANLAGGEATVGIALVLAEPVAREQVAARASAALQAASLPALAQLLLLEALPRLANGKPDRLRLQHLLRETPRS